jgi:glycosyltransferase involved in cell wall biosynthesis
VRRLHVVAPEGFDDPDRPSGGNVYDRRVCGGLADAGWDVRIVTVGGPWPVGDSVKLARVVATIPDDETVLIDGLIASPSAAQLLPHAERLRLMVLLHMPLVLAGRSVAMQQSERAVLAAAAGIVVTSRWTRREVVTRFAVPDGRVRVARPGADRADVAASSVAGRHLLCVGTLARHKGQDLLVDALVQVADSEWTCVLAGPLDREPAFVDQLRDRIAQLGLADRIRLTGVLTGQTLDRAYAAADLLVTPSRFDTYGMVVAEALAHGRPVVATEVGGLPEALGFAPDRTRPGELVPPDDVPALASALNRWLGDELYRDRLSSAAVQRRATLAGWDQTVRDLAAAMDADGVVRHA